jgi:hypothetical protein
MKKRFIYAFVLIIFLLCRSAICSATESPDPTDPNRYLNAVRAFADNVLKYGRDTYRPRCACQGPMGPYEICSLHLSTVNKTTVNFGLCY